MKVKYEKYKWPLNDNHFSWFDRLKIVSFILNPRNKWTSGEKVINFERVWRNISLYRHTVMTSSGSTAIEILARTWRELYGGKYILLPALTWYTSVTPWIYAGYEPVFVDVDKNTMCMSAYDLFNKAYKYNDIVGAFPTNVLGSQCNEHGWRSCLPRTAIDNCESTFSIYKYNSTTVTSFYMGRQLTTGTEGGMLFTNNYDEFKKFVYIRGHGLAREMSKYDNKVVGKFDFDDFGSNFRSHDLAAYMGYLDTKKYWFKNEYRNKLYSIFKDNISKKYMTFNLNGPSAIPIITEAIDKIRLKIILEDFGIETRPLISGNLLKHKPFQKYGKPEDFPNTTYLDNNGFYIGLHEKITKKDIYKLVEILNEAVCN